MVTSLRGRFHANLKWVDKAMEGVSGQHGPSFRSLGTVFANNCTALESSKVGYACALTIIANGGNARSMNASLVPRLSLGTRLHE